MLGFFQSLNAVDVTGDSAKLSNSNRNENCKTRLDGVDLSPKPGKTCLYDEAASGVKQIEENRVAHLQLLFGRWVEGSTLRPLRLFVDL